jgi:predicted transcriptional regulator
MLEHLFGSKTRVKLLRIFLGNPSQPYYLRELARKLGMQLNSIRREVDNLEKIGIIKSLTGQSPATEEGEDGGKSSGSKKYFLVDTSFVLYPELKALLLKAQLLYEKNFVNKIEKMAQVKLLILTGIFVGLEGSTTDLLLVGAVNRNKLARIVSDFERNLDRSINYTVMSYQEFKYRQDITDKFLYDILEGRKIVVIDKINLVSR